MRGWRGGGGTGNTEPASLLSRVGGGGGGEVRVTVLALNETWMHVDLSFSYLRSAEAASFDKKSSTGTAQALKSKNRGGEKRRLSESPRSTADFVTNSERRHKRFILYSVINFYDLH